MGEADEGFKGTDEANTDVLVQSTVGEYVWVRWKRHWW